MYALSVRVTPGGISRRVPQYSRLKVSHLSIIISYGQFYCFSAVSTCASDMRAPKPKRGSSQKARQRPLKFKAPGQMFSGELCPCPLLGMQFRDISDYKRAFSSSRNSSNVHPDSTVDRRPWLEEHLEHRAPPHPSSEPVQSLLHWLDGRCESPARELLIRDDSPQRDSDDEEFSPYLSEFCHSQSLDFATFGDLDDL